MDRVTVTSADWTASRKGLNSCDESMAMAMQDWVSSLARAAGKTREGASGSTCAAVPFNKSPILNFLRARFGLAFVR
jgi:hypothetical protein